MSFQSPITIKDAIDNIENKKYLLPAIQREFVWDTEQIIRLFDSLMRGYPIGSFLFWQLNKESRSNFQFYEFIREYHERDRKHNLPIKISSAEEEKLAILDGQQRLTSLYIGLKGTYADKLPRYRWDNPFSFPVRKLYLNLLTKPENGDLEYNFQFLKHDDITNNNENYWFEVGEILRLKEPHEVNDYLVNNNLMTKDKEKAKFANRTLFKLHDVVYKIQSINYYMEKDESLDKVLNVFIRVNSGGTTLSYSDLLLSIATAEWKGQEQNARQTITDFVDELNRYGEGFNFTKDLVLKSTLVLNDIPDIAFKVDNFKQDNMAIIEKNWNQVSSALRLAVELIVDFGYSRDTLSSTNAIIPIAYYLKQLGLPQNFVKNSKFKNSREKIKKWLIRSLLKQVFAGSSDTFLTQIRSLLKDIKGDFPLEDIIEYFKGKPKSIIFSDEDIEHIFSYQYGKNYTFSALALLYPSFDFSKKRFHQDHIFPKNLFKRRNLRNIGLEDELIDIYLSKMNSLANLQLLEGNLNQEKSGKDFREWLDDNFHNEAIRKAYMKEHFIPDNIDFSLDKFMEFIDKRTKLMSDYFAEILR